MASVADQLASNINFGAFAKATELKRRIWFAVGCLIVYRIGTYIPLPGIDPQVMAQIFAQQAGGIMGMFNMFAGGALERMSIFALGILPYISASIIMQLMTAISPSVAQLKKEGEAGRKKINQYTRYLTVLLAAVQAYGLSVGLESMGGPGGSADTAVLELRLKPDAIAGPFRQVLRVETGDARMPTLDFTVTGTILGDLTTSPGRVNFRFVKPGQELSKEIAVKPKAAALAFTVTGASVDLPGLSAEVLADGSGGDARVRISGTALAAEDSLAVASQGRLKSHLHIYTDRPEEPELQVDVLYMLR